ncbi:MAG TPA: ChbG/HpnK family deacetylase [Polyangia bacterium]|nr:ChbG/HpnK family deacetylase [Polyangia bacterium]
MSPAISRGILRAHREGIVTSTSLLGNAPDLPAVKALLAGAPALGVGVHLVLCGGRPVAPPDSVRSLLGPDGAFHARGQSFIAALVRGRVAPAEIERELDAQVTRVREAGIAVDHLDTHHHLGFLPAVGRAVEAVARRHDIAGIRSAVESPTLAWVADPRRGLEAGVLTLSAWLTRRQLGARRHGPQSWGYVESGHLDEIRILEIVGRLGPGPHELICHPGEAPADGEAPEASARYQRTAELASLTSAKVRRALERRQIRLCRWGDLF